MQTRNTIRRQIVLQAVNQMHNHPTADADLCRYRGAASDHQQGHGCNLNQLAAQGEILRVPVPTGADHFDFNIKPHYHVRCTKCGGVFDVFMPPVTDLIDRVEDSSGGELHRYEILFEGILQRLQERLKSSRMV